MSASRAGCASSITESPIAGDMAGEEKPLPGVRSPNWRRDRGSSQCRLPSGVGRPRRQLTRVLPTTQRRPENGIPGVWRNGRPVHRRNEPVARPSGVAKQWATGMVPLAVPTVAEAGRSAPSLVVETRPPGCREPVALAIRSCSDGDDVVSVELRDAQNRRSGRRRSGGHAAGRDEPVAPGRQGWPPWATIGAAERKASLQSRGTRRHRS